jgi:thiamine-monophosphate kinase
MKDSDEFKVLKKVFKNLGNQYFDSSSLLIGPGDDAGLFKAKKELIFSTDTSVGDVHFPKDLEAKLIAYRACAIAASDIAACGGSLKWLSISLTTANKNTKWIENFSKGIKEFSDFYKVPVIGGDLAVGKEISGFSWRLWRNS